MDDNFKSYMLIAQAAQLLGVSEGTLRNWERAGKIGVLRHPINHYRLYRRADLESILAASGAGNQKLQQAGKSSN